MFSIGGCAARQKAGVFIPNHNIPTPAQDLARMERRAKQGVRKTVRS